MKPDQLPAPLVPSEVDLRGLEYMPLLGGKLFSSDFNLDASDTEFRIAVKLWWAAWNQVPAGSLPGQDNRIRALAGLEENATKWRKVRERALHGFIECGDGRLYHPIISQQALIAWEKRAESIAERDNESERQRRVRAERKRLFQMLREVGITPKYDLKMDDLRALVTEHVTVTTSHPVTPPVTVTDTANTGRDGTGHKYRADNTRSSPSPRAEREPDTAGFVPTDAGRICLAMKRIGIADVNPGHPDLLALIEAGASDAEFSGAAQTARDRGKGFAYAIGALKRQRLDAAQTAQAMHKGAMPTAPPPRQSATERQIATMDALTGKDRNHDRDRTPPADTIDIDARVVP